MLFSLIYQKTTVQVTNFMPTSDVTNNNICLYLGSIFPRGEPRMSRHQTWPHGSVVRAVLGSAKLGIVHAGSRGVQANLSLEPILETLHITHWTGLLFLTKWGRRGRITAPRSENQVVNITVKQLPSLTKKERANVTEPSYVYIFFNKRGFLNIGHLGLFNSPSVPCSLCEI